jgi:membrane dipeptidase
VADHIERAARIAGIEHVGLGSDFDGVGDSLPDGLKDVSMYPNLFAELLRRGFDESDSALVAGENVLRVMAEVERVAAAAGADATAAGR